MVVERILNTLVGQLSIVTCLGRILAAVPYMYQVKAAQVRTAGGGGNVVNFVTSVC